MGPHLASSRDFGNALSREPLENYVSPAYDLQGRTPARISWEAAVPANTAVQLQLRGGDSEEALDAAVWTGPDGEGSFYEESGSVVVGMDGARWLQYRATLVHGNGCRSPGLSEVRVEFEG